MNPEQSRVPLEAPQPPGTADGRHDPRRTSEPISIRIPAGDAARAAAAVLVVWAAAQVLGRVLEVLLLMVSALLLATAIGPVVDWLRRGRLTHGMGVLVVYFGMMVAVGLPLYLLIPSVLSQASTFTQTLPNRLSALEPYVAGLQPAALRDAAIDALNQVQAALTNPQAPAQEQLVEAGTQAAHAIFDFVTVFVLAFYWLVERDSIRRGVLRLASPEQAPHVNSIWEDMEERLGGWVRGELILMAAVGLMAGVGYAVIGLPNAALLGVISGLLEVVPMIGPFAAFAPAVLVALTLDPTRALVTVVYAAVIQQFESNILVPRVMGPSVGISPLTVLIGILIGSVLYGLPGTFVAVPITAAVQVLLAHLTRQEEPHSSPSTRS